MHHEPRWRRYIRFWRRNVNADVDHELAFHFEQRVAEFIAAGATRADAEARAAERFGNVAHAREELVGIGRRLSRHHDYAQGVDNLRQDVAFAVRGLRRAPGLSVACILTIALGVGANGAMFSLADRMFARPPAGVRDPATLRRIYVRTTWTIGSVPMVRPTFTVRTFGLLDSALAPRLQLAGYTKADTMPMTIGDGPVLTPLNVHGQYVSADYMPVLGVRPAIGRFFAPEEEVFSSPVYVAVISDRLWHRLFNGDRNIIGKTVELNRQRTTIIGVAPPGFDGPDLNATEVWLPLSAHSGDRQETWSNSWFTSTDLRIIARVPRGTTDEWISNAATTIVRRTRVEMGSGGKYTNAVRDSTALMLAGPILESLGPSVTVAPSVAIATRLIGVTIIVLLIACANVASLLLARAMGRRREIAVRIALGVSRARLVAQLLCEGLVLAAAAGTAALIVCVWAGNALRRLIMPSTYWADSAVDVRVVGFIGLVALGTGVLAGLVPALQASRPELAEALKSGARDGGASAHRSRLRQLLLIAQIAMSVLLLYGAGLFVHSLVRLRAIDLGFDADRVVYGSMYLLDSAGKYIDPGSYRSPRAGQALMQTAQRMMASPDVEQVALSTGGPLAGYAMIGVYNQDGTAAPELDKRSAVWYATTPSFFDATGAHLARGRLPSKSDRDGPPVMVVNETAARFYWPQREAIGQCLRLFRAESPCVTVIGVVRDSHVSDVVEKPVAQLVTPFEYDSSGRPGGASTVIVRAKPGRAAMVQAALRRELLRDVPTGIAIVAPASERLAEQLRPWRVGLLLFGAFGALAFVLAALGTYSVLSYAVTQRLHEISVRMALGARGADVLMLVVAQGVRTALIGVVAGLTIAMLASRVMQSMLYDTSPQEPLVTIAVASLLLAMAAAASALPARRAARLDPAGALRAE